MIKERNHYTIINNLSYGLRVFLLLVFILLPCFLYSQELLKADGPGNTYELIRSKGLKLEVPDCVHPVKHVSEIWDDNLKEYVFEFGSHINLDNDRCRNFDRIRTELTVTDSTPPSYLGAREGDTFTYTWKFKLDSGFLANPSFCHIHQIKAVGGNDGAPIITLTTRKGNPDMLQLIYSAPSGESGSRTLSEVDLARLKGIWIQALETVTYKVDGKYSILLTRIDKKDTLFACSKNNIYMSRPGAYFYRPKIGIYRSLKNKSAIRDENIRFADFGIAKGIIPCIDSNINNIAPAAPNNVKITPLSNSEVNIRWYDASYNEDHFKIERSTNQTNWVSAGLIVPAWERWLPQIQILNYNDSSLSAGTKYYYRICAENLFGTSDYSSLVSVFTNPMDVNNKEKIPTEFFFEVNPNPFNPITEISYHIPIASHVHIIIYDSLGKKVTTLVNEFQNTGIYNYTLNADSVSGNHLPSGVYFARFQADNLVRVIKIMLLK